MLREYTVPKGKHKSYPTRFFSRVGFGNYSPEECEIIQDGRSVYLLYTPDGDISVDQWDWCKVLGRRFSLDPHGNVYMLATRYNHELRVFEYTAYYHRNGKVYIRSGDELNELTLGEFLKGQYDLHYTANATREREVYLNKFVHAEPMLRVAIGDAITVREIARHDHGEYGLDLFYGDTMRSSVMGLNRNCLKFHQKINPWFGGNKAAPINWKLFISSNW